MERLLGCCVNYFFLTCLDGFRQVDAGCCVKHFFLTCLDGFRQVDAVGFVRN